jgi:hypothetical protein
LLSHFRGEVRDFNGERHLVGSFALHPFHILVALIPIAALALILWLFNTVWEFVFIAFWAAFEFIYLGSLRRHRPLEKKRIVVFLDTLFVELGPKVLINAEIAEVDRRKEVYR